LDSSKGIKIIGNPNDQNTGLALSSAGDFNNDNSSDLLFSAIQISPNQNVIYILFLNSNILKRDISMNNLLPDKDYLKIVAPLLSFAGFSLSNLGDINHDGFDDIIIGSIPYSGKYLTQKSYVIYGRNSSLNLLSLTEMTAEDGGFTITGGGFMVGGPGDMNGDGIPDIMISSYQQWQGKGNSYIMIYPRNVTSPPTFLPSSQPSSTPSSSPTTVSSIRTYNPTSRPTIQETTNQPVSDETFPPYLERTQPPSVAPKTSKPTRTPSIKPSTRSPTVKTLPPSALPSLNPTPDPTVTPTRLPTTTRTPSRSPTKRLILSAYPSSFPSITPTESFSTPFQELVIEREGVYDVPSGKTDFIISGEGSIEITSNGGGKKVYTILPAQNSITITDFNKKYDQIRLIHFPSLFSMNDIFYRTNPLTIFLSNEQKLILLSILDASDLTEDNFIFYNENQHMKKATEFQLDASAMISLGILLGCLGIIGCFTKLNQTEEDKEECRFNEKENSRQKWKIESLQRRKELNESLSSDLDSFLLSSSQSEDEDDDEENEEHNVIQERIIENEQHEEESNEDWSFYSSSDDSEDNNESNKNDSEVNGSKTRFPFLKILTSVEDEDKEESDEECDSSIDLEGNYLEEETDEDDDDDDMEDDVSLIRKLFKNYPGQEIDIEENK
jgi:hypothetical protein